MSRRKPYTEIGIRRLKCSRAGCENRAVHQWNICADGNQYRAICSECDIAINELVLRFMGWADAEHKLDTYRQTCRAAELRDKVRGTLSEGER